MRILFRGRGLAPLAVSDITVRRATRIGSGPFLQYAVYLGEPLRLHCSWRSMAYAHTDETQLEWFCRPVDSRLSAQVAKTVW